MKLGAAPVGRSTCSTWVSARKLFARCEICGVNESELSCRCLSIFYFVSKGIVLVLIVSNVCKQRRRLDGDHNLSMMVLL